MDFAVPTDHRVKLKEREKNDKYRDFEKTIENEGEEVLEIRERVATIQTIALLRSARKVLETWGDLLSLKIQWETIS